MDGSQEFVEHWVIGQLQGCPKALKAYTQTRYMAAREYLKMEWRGSTESLNGIRQLIFQIYLANTLFLAKDGDARSCKFRQLADKIKSGEICAAP